MVRGPASGLGCRHRPCRRRGRGTSCRLGPSGRRCSCRAGPGAARRRSRPSGETAARWLPLGSPSARIVWKACSYPLLPGWRKSRWESGKRLYGELAVGGAVEPLGHEVPPVALRAACTWSSLLPARRAISDRRARGRRSPWRFLAAGWVVDPVELEDPVREARSASSCPDLSLERLGVKGGRAFGLEARRRCQPGGSRAAHPGSVSPSETARADLAAKPRPQARKGTDVDRMTAADCGPRVGANRARQLAADVPEPRRPR